MNDRTPRIPPTAREVFDAPMHPSSNDAGASSVGEYLLKLLALLWKQGEDAIKRPFGNSGWQYEVYAALIREGVVEGGLDEGGYVEDVDRRTADTAILAAINGARL